MKAANSFLCVKCFRQDGGDVTFQGGAPWFASFQAGAFRADLLVVHPSGKAPVNSVKVELKTEQIRTKPLDCSRKRSRRLILTQAPLIVAIGRGIKAPENIPQAEALAKALGGEIAASRPICDEGWLPMERQIGSSGQDCGAKAVPGAGHQWSDPACGGHEGRAHYCCD